MAITLRNIEQARNSTEIWPVELTDSLLGGATILGATGTIAYSDSSVSGAVTGSVGTIVVASPDSNGKHYIYVPVTFGLTATFGVHWVDVTVTIDNTGTLVNETPIHRLEIMVRR
jgi:hypothetical protein